MVIATVIPVVAPNTGSPLVISMVGRYAFEAETFELSGAMSSKRENASNAEVFLELIEDRA